MSNTKSPDSDGKGDTDAEVGTVGSAADLTSEPVASSRGGMWIVAAVGFVVLVLDQITKIWAVSALDDNRIIDLFWTGRFNLTRNFGSAFGLGSSIGRWLGLLIVGVIIAVLLYARQIKDRRMLALLGAIAGGAIGNLVDRILRAEDGFMSGGVIDFIDFQWWPIFNVADMAVVCGAIGLMLLSMREPVETDEVTTDDDDTDDSDDADDPDMDDTTDAEETVES